MKVTRRKFLFGLCAAWATRLELPLHAAEVPGHVELKNEFFQLRLRAKAGELWLDQLLLNQEPSATGAGFTPNLLASDPEKIPLHSSTAILQEGKGWLTARLKFPAKITRGHSKRRGEWLRVDDIWLGPEAEPVVRETWLLELRANQLRWKIARNFLRDARLIADRFPALLLRTFILGPQHPRAQRWHGAAQVPGFLDPDMQLDGQHAFPLPHPDREWFEVISPKRDQEIHLAPSGLSLESKLSTGWFGYAKPATAR